MSAKQSAKREEFEKRELARQRMLTWQKGWDCGAAFLPIPEGLSDDEDFSDGWQHGRSARTTAHHFAGRIYGVPVHCVRPAKGGGE